MTEPRLEELFFARYQRTGESRALERVYALTAPRLVESARRWVADGSGTHVDTEAEDLVHATFVTAIQRADSFEAGRPLFPWLLGILSNEGKRARRRRSRRVDPVRFASNVTRAVHDPVTDAKRSELEERVDRAIERLPDSFRDPIRLRLFERLTLAEISTRLRRPAGTVRSQIDRAMRRLRASLSPADSGSWLGFIGVWFGARKATGCASTARWLGVLLVKKMVLVGTGVSLLIALVIAFFLAPRSEPAPVDGGPRTLVDAGATTLLGGKQADVVEASFPIAAPRRLGFQAPNLPAPGHLTVQVVWGEGSAVEGELVIVSRNDLERPHRELDETVLITDRSGRAMLRDILPGIVDVRLLRGEGCQVPIEPGRRSQISLSIDPGLCVVGTVRDVEGRAVGGAEIWLSERHRMDKGFVVSRADAFGEFVLDAVSRDQSLCALAPGFGPSRLHAVNGNIGDRVAVEIVLSRPGSSIFGRVYGEGGEPVAGARILVGSDEGSEEDRVERGALLRATSDEHGAFHVNCVATGWAEIQVWARSYAFWRGRVEVASGLSNPIDVFLRPPSMVRGTVRDSQGVLLAGVSVAAVGEGEFSTSSAVSSEAGSFSLSGLAAGEVTLRAKSEELGSAWTSFVLAEAEIKHVDLTIEPTPRIHGVLVDQDENPLSGWVVVARRAGAQDQRHRSLPSGPDGRFVLSDLLELPYIVEVKEPGDWRRWPRLVLDRVEPSAPPLRLVIPDLRFETARIVGRIVDSNDYPVLGATVSIWNEDHRLWRSFFAHSETGEFDVLDILPGRCFSTVRGSGYPEIRLGEVDLRAGDLHDFGEIVLPAGAFVTGSVTWPPDWNGGAGDIEIAFFDDDGQVATGEVDATNGSYRSEPLREGALKLRVGGDGLVSQVHRVAPKSGELMGLDLDLEMAFVHRVEFILPRTKEAPRWMWVRVEDLSGREVWRKGGLRPDGERIVARISARPGSYRLYGETNNGLSVDAAIFLKEDGLERELLTLPLVRKD